MRLITSFAEIFIYIEGIKSGLNIEGYILNTRKSNKEKFILNEKNQTDRKWFVHMY